ncbi:putative bacteriophage protein [Burkholderia humptydooensis MSMB43]|nr:putative bacteriophage protein [Burkholderia humptydooensis MSMB43]
MKETNMSLAAQDLIELLRLAQGGAGALTQHLLREVAGNLIAFGVADCRGGC